MAKMWCYGITLVSLRSPVPLNRFNQLTVSHKTWYWVSCTYGTNYVI